MNSIKIIVSKNKLIRYGFSLLISVVVFLLTVAIASGIIKKDILPFGICKGCNVILISLDTLRSNSLFCYGYNKNTDPFLCDLASKSFLFKNSYSQSAYTLDSHLSIFTSVYPSVHQVITPYTSVLSEQLLIIPQILEKKDFYNFYSGPIVDPSLPLDKGFGRSYNNISAGSDPLGWIESFEMQNNNKKFFAFLHTYEVHEPYLPSESNLSKFYSGSETAFITQEELCDKTYRKFIDYYPERSKADPVENEEGNKNNYCSLLDSYYRAYPDSSFDELNKNYQIALSSFWETFESIELNEKKKYIQALYETKIYELDLKLKEFFNYLKKRGLLNNTIIVITADHGESFFEHGTWTHAANVYQEVIKVPLIIYVPNAKPLVIDKLAQGVDIFPTLLYLLGIEDDSIKKQLRGINLFSAKENQYVISQHFADDKQAIIGKEWKLIVNNDNPDGKVTRELYNLIKDPEEKENLIELKTRRSASMEKTLMKILARQPVYEQKTEPFPSWIDENQRRKLIETGYF